MRTARQGLRWVLLEEVSTFICGSFSKSCSQILTNTKTAFVGRIGQKVCDSGNHLLHHLISKNCGIIYGHHSLLQTSFSAKMLPVLCRMRRDKDDLGASQDGYHKCVCCMEQVSSKLRIRCVWPSSGAAVRTVRP